MNYILKLDKLKKHQHLSVQLYVVITHLQMQCVMLSYQQGEVESFISVYTK